MKANIVSQQRFARLTKGEPFFSAKEFVQIGVVPTLQTCLRNCGFSRPSKIQSLVFKDAVEGNSCIIADQAGSGKTLAYLLPLFQRVLLNEEGNLRNTVSKSPRIVVIAPTSELCRQIGVVLKDLSTQLSIKSSVFTSLSDADSEERLIRLGLDVLVTTPGQLASSLKKKRLTLEHTEALVLDEADVQFMDETFPLPYIFSKTHTNTQYLFVTATIPDVIRNDIQAQFPNITYIHGPGLHRVAMNVELTVYDCSGNFHQTRGYEAVMANKRNALCDLISNSVETTVEEKILVFCNTVTQCRVVENILQRHDRSGREYSVYGYHSAIDPQTQQRNLYAFTHTRPGDLSILVCSDRASRGIDFFQKQMDHIILFDFPQEPGEFIRRIGRTGRAGKEGKASLLVYGKQVRYARELQRAIREGREISINIEERMDFKQEK